MTRRAAYPAPAARTPHPLSFLRTFRPLERLEKRCVGPSARSRGRGEYERNQGLAGRFRPERPERLEMPSNTCARETPGSGVKCGSYALVGISGRSGRSGRDPPHSVFLYNGLSLVASQAFQAVILYLGPFKPTSHSFEINSLCFFLSGKLNIEVTA